MPVSIQTIGVVGSGVMGIGIAQLFAQAGREIRLFDSNAEAMARALAGLEAVLARLVEKQRLAPQDAATLRARIRPCATLAELGECDLVIEAIIEQLAAKRALFVALAAIVRSDAILATNTSSLSVAEIFQGVPGPERSIGLHFFNPVPLMKLAEIIPTARTSPDNVDAVTVLVTAAGHQGIAALDSPGFVVNHFGRAFVTEGLAILEEGVCDPATLDLILRESLGFRMGPCELLDLTGLDVSVPVMESLYAGFYHEPRLRPVAGGRQRLLNGLLGRKAGAGFFRYAEGKRVAEEAAAPVAAGPLPSVHLIDAEQFSGAEQWLEATAAPRAELATANLVLVAPVGGDVSQAVVGRGLDPVRSIGIDGLFSHRGFATLATTPATGQAAKDHASRLLAAAPGALIGDSCGFVAPRVLASIVNLAADMAQKRIATPADIDRGATLALGYPQGPFAWADAVGPATLLAISEGLWGATGDPRYRPSLWLRRRAGLGLSLGAGA